MAKPKQPPSSTPLREPYPIFKIDRSFAAEGARRNIEVVIWYKRLINATLALVVVSILFSVMSMAFAFIQPMPMLYGSSADGALRSIEYVREPNDQRLIQLRSGLMMEEVSRAQVNSRQSVESLRQGLAVRPVFPTGPSTPVGAAAPAAPAVSPASAQ